MARRWLSVTVELVGGRGEELWPYPGRVFVVGPAHTFADLNDAANAAFGRWDRSHLAMFTLASGQVLTDAELAQDLQDSPMSGPEPAPADFTTAKVKRFVDRGEQFQYVFDLGDDWTHCCTVGDEYVDPEQMYGVVPRKPVAYRGWGALPDQYGRRWADDDGSGGTPPRPRREHPMISGRWPRGE